MKVVKKLRTAFLVLALLFAGTFSASGVVAVDEGNGLPNLKIAKISTDDGWVEIYNSSEGEIDLRGVRVVYYSATRTEIGSPTRVVVEINEELILEGYGVMRFEGSLAKSGGSVGLLYGDEVLDLVGWGSASRLFEEKKVVSRVSNFGAFGRCTDSNGEMFDSDNNAEDFDDARGLGLGEYAECAVPEEEVLPEADSGPVKDCSVLEINEIGANMANERQFVEVRNTSRMGFNVGGCKIATAKSRAVFIFPDEELRSGELLAVNPDSQGLRLIKTTTDTVYVLSSDGTEVDEVSYANLRAGTSFAKFDRGWAQTFVTTPDEENVYAEFAPCPVGQERNPATGRCVMIRIDIKTEKVCAEDQYLNPLTNRCKKIPVEKDLSCPEGQYRNPETGRCRKIVVPAGVAPCAEGYERNPDTNRCRKIRENLGAGYGVRNDSEPDSGSWAALVSMVLLGAAGVVYLIFSFRVEIAKYTAMGYDKLREKIRELVAKLCHRRDVNADNGA
ncbi:hypothetical protein FWH09_02190 [Candidatus Saccharibacteria bacterium]|nr:hypothetical protein [Candidatus Saccharibacteria bacterium]